MKLFSLFSFLWNYFFSEPFEMNFRLNILGGFWPLHTKVLWQKILFSIFSWVSVFSLSSTLVSQLLDLYILRTDPLLMTKHFSIISISFGIVVKGHVNMLRVHLIEALKADMDNYLNTRTDVTEIEILRKADRTIVDYTKALYLFGVTTVVIWGAYPAIESSKEKSLLYPYRFPVEEYTWSLYVGLYVYQVLASIGFLLFIFSVEGIFCGFVHRICAHYDIIIKNINEMNSMTTSGGAEIDQQLKHRLHENVKLHNRILWQMKIMEDIYSQLALIHFAMVAAGIATLVFDSLILYRGFRLELLQRISFMGAALWDTFLYCYFGSKLHDKSLELSNEIYFMKWYEMKPTVRKEILIVLVKTQRPSKFRVGRFFPLEVSSFGSFLKLAYTSISVLYQTTSIKFG